MTALKVKVGPSTCEDLLGAYNKLRQFETVEEYQSQFEVLSNRIKGLTEEFKISSFNSGLWMIYGLW